MLFNWLGYFARFIGDIQPSELISACEWFVSNEAERVKVPFFGHSVIMIKWSLILIRHIVAFLDKVLGGFKQAANSVIRSQETTEELENGQLLRRYGFVW